MNSIGRLRAVSIEKKKFNVNKTIAYLEDMENTSHIPLKTFLVDTVEIDFGG